MRIVSYLLLVFMVVSLSSCKFFKKQQLMSNGPDTLLAQPQIVVEASPAIDTTELVQIVQEVEPQVYSNEPITGYSSDRYYMVVGSFLSEKLANKYAKTILDMGYQSNVIYSSIDGFYRVSAQSYNDMATAVSDINNFRANVTGHAWVHVKR